MTSPLQILARNIGAAAMAPAKNGQSVYLLEESDGDLVQELWHENEPDFRTLVADGVMENTAALYLMGGSDEKPKRLVFFLDDTEHLKCVEYDENSEEWEGAAFNDKLAEIKVHSNTQLSGISTEWGVMIIFETEPGTLAILVGSGDHWRVSGEIPTKIRPGTAHMILDHQEKLQLFCFGEDDQIYHLTLPYGERDWQASVVEGTKLEAAPSKIMAYPKEGESSFEFYILLSTSQFIRIDSKGDKTDLGLIKEGKLIPSTAAECCLVGPFLQVLAHLMENFWHIKVQEVPQKRVFIF